MDDAVAPEASCEGFVSQVFVFGATRYLLMTFTLLSESSRFTLSQSDCFNRLPLAGPPGNPNRIQLVRGVGLAEPFFCCSSATSKISTSAYSLPGGTKFFARSLTSAIRAWLRGAKRRGKG